MHFDVCSDFTFPNVFRIPQIRYDKGAESNQGVFFYPMQLYAAPNRTILVNDQTKQPAVGTNGTDHIRQSPPSEHEVSQ